MSASGSAQHKRLLDDAPGGAGPDAVGEDEQWDVEDQPGSKQAAKKDKSTALAVSFVALVIIGLGNKIFSILQTRPMRNYPFFLNLFMTFVYIPMSFIYIIPMQLFGTAITPECTAIPKHKFAVMGILDGIAGIMQVFSINYILNSSLVVLLQQAAIPISMAISRALLKAKYTLFQYIGATVVVAGIIVVLLPSFAGKQSPEDDNGQSQLLWSMVMVLSCIPMTLSSVYKEKALGETDVDVVYLNGWVAIFQFLVSLPMALPSAPVTGIAIHDIPSNTWNGMRCYLGIDSVTNATATAAMPIDDCSTSFPFVTTYLGFNIGFNILIIMILKYGSSNILWLAMTIMVPMSNVAFSLKFIPGNRPLKSTDIMGLVVIMAGLLVYRFVDKIIAACGPAGKTVRSASFSVPDADQDEAARHVTRFAGVTALEASQAVVFSVARQRVDAREALKRTRAQIQNSYLNRLGFASPSISRTVSPGSAAAQGSSRGKGEMVRPI